MRRDFWSATTASLQVVGIVSSICEAIHVGWASCPAPLDKHRNKFPSMWRPEFIRELWSATTVSLQAALVALGLSCVRRTGPHSCVEPEAKSRS